MNEMACSTCDGSGMLQDELGSYACPNCTVMQDQCETCMGTGELQDSEGKMDDCHACDGSGMKPHIKEAWGVKDFEDFNKRHPKPTDFEDDQVSCEDCKGRGLNLMDTNEPCETCGGSGEVSRPQNLPENKGLQFDKFMDRIVTLEGANRVHVKQEDNPLRRRAALHQDRPANRTVIGPRK